MKTNYLKYSFNRILKISLRSRYRAPDPVYLAKTGSSPLLVGKFNNNCIQTIELLISYLIVNNNFKKDRRYAVDSIVFFLWYLFHTLRGLSSFFDQIVFQVLYGGLNTRGGGRVGYSLGTHSSYHLGPRCVLQTELAGKPPTWNPPPPWKIHLGCKIWINTTVKTKRKKWIEGLKNTILYRF